MKLEVWRGVENWQTAYENVINRSSKPEYDAFVREIIECKLCFGECQTKRVLLGRGDLNAEIMFVGIGPNIRKEGFGQVFGEYAPSGKIFHKLLDLINPKSFWVTNVIKCSVPKVKLGDPEKCVEFFWRELRLIRPKLVVLFGKDVVKHVILKDEPLTGKIINFHGYRFITCPHPHAVARETIPFESLANVAKKIVKEYASCLDRWFK